MNRKGLRCGPALAPMKRPGSFAPSQDTPTLPLLPCPQASVATLEGLGLHLLTEELVWLPPSR